MPIDPSLGNARKIEETQESIIEHIFAGGPVMLPILVLAFAAFAVTIFKWVQLSTIPRPPEKKVHGVLEAVRRKDYVQAAKIATDLKGPEGEMIRAGLDHIRETKELVEEMMFEKMLDTRLKLQSFLSFIAISAAAAPLLGLLGTVTGIINTFKLITVYGTGDAKTLSSGISEALITTEYGLIVAIPSLLLHAYLSRRAKKFVDGMEKTAIALLNRISNREEEQAEEVVESKAASR
ncbi:MAG: MotA/TolQ/ExbB proton channel family protein [Acidobacteria bacterium]|nr:MotA/TolQ/ExbB proton channel family protein [Acidobacteriota bacterium]